MVDDPFASLNGGGFMQHTQLARAMRSQEVIAASVNKVPASLFSLRIFDDKQ